MATSSPNPRPFTPDSPGWEEGVRLSPCPSWCDGEHGLIMNAAYDKSGATVSGDAVHHSADLAVPDEAARIRGDGMLLYLEQYPDGEAPDASETLYVVCGDARLTSASARTAGRHLLWLADLAEAAPPSPPTPGEQGFTTLFDVGVHNPLGTHLEACKVVPGSTLPVWVDEIDGRRMLFVNQEEAAPETVRALIDTLNAALAIAEGRS